MTHRQTKVKQVAAAILQDAAATLDSYGRPRKRPGHATRPRTDGIRMNTVAAIDNSIRYQRANKLASSATIGRARTLAYRTLNAAIFGEMVLSKFAVSNVEYYDGEERDTREIVRALDKAAKGLAAK